MKQRTGKQRRQEVRGVTNRLGCDVEQGVTLLGGDADARILGYEDSMALNG